MIEREALKLALEALEAHADIGIKSDKPITAIKEALAQPEQEPVAYSYTSRITGAQGFSHHPMPRFIDSDSWDIKPLYTTPPQRTDQEQQIETLKRCLFQMQEAAKNLVEQAKSLPQPQRTWVEIDGDDWIKALEMADFDTVAAFEFFEAKLKELNT